VTDADRHLLGAYKTPQFRYGDRVRCEVRGELVVVGLSDAPVPWPIGKPHKGRGKSLVVYKDLAEAVRRESAAAVCHWWGVSPATVWLWRKAMGVGQMTEGTTLLKTRSAQDSPAVAAALAKSRVKDRDPERVRKIREAKRGKARPDHVIEAMRQANLGRKRSAETRRKMSAAKKGKPRPPRRDWADWELALLGELPDDEVARRIGRSYASVGSRRRKKGREPVDRG
jgi:hypothetical protein